MAEAIVTLPDGRRAKLTGPSREAIAEKARQISGGGGVLAGSGTLQRGPSGQVTGSTFDSAMPEIPQTDGAGTTFVGGIGESLADSGMGLMKLAARDLGRGLLGPGAAQPIEGMLGNLPTGRDVLSGIDALPGMLAGNPGSFDEARQNRQASAEANPNASAFGNVAGDALSILAGRAPFVRANAAPKAAAAVKEVAPGFKKFAQQVWESPAVQKLASGAGRAGEAGLEGAALAALKDGDPLETAAYAAGGQAAGSLALQLADFSGAKDILKGDVFKGVGKLTMAAVLTGSAMQYLDAAVPGNKDWLIENIETGYDKVLLMMLAGAGAGLAGAGRIKGENFPVLADAVTALPRGAIISLWEDLAGNDDAKKAMSLLASRPDAHSKAQIQALEKGIFDKGESFSREVERLREEDEKYREMFDAPHPKLIGVPKMEED